MFFRKGRPAASTSIATAKQPLALACAIFSLMVSIFQGLIVGTPQPFAAPMAFVAISSYAQPSFEMGYAFKFFRVLMLILTQLFGLWGLLGGAILMLISLICTETFTGKGYFYPIIPFNATDFRKMFIRRKLKNSK